MGCGKYQKLISIKIKNFFRIDECLALFKGGLAIGGTGGIPDGHFSEGCIGL